MTFDEIQARAKAEWQALERSDKPRILIGAATCGRAAGADAVLDAITAELSRHHIEATVTKVGCIGLCYAEPLVTIVKPAGPGVFYHNVTPEMVPRLIKDYLIDDNPHPDLALGTTGSGTIAGIPRLFDLSILKPQVRIALRNCGLIDPENINHYIANDGYSGLAKALKMTPEGIIEEVKRSGLRGLGGAGFPAGQKWGSCRQAPGEEKYVICNASEGDPGAFQDRSLIEGDPHSVLEGMVIAGYAVGARRGFIYVGAEYPLAMKRLKIAITQDREKGFLGEDILDSGFDFDIEIFQGGGAFVCGESTALVLCIEGKRGMPKPLPRPRTTEVGLWDKPTLLNNVKTFANIPLIITQGWGWFASRGTEKSKGTAIFSLTGNVERTGLIEVPMGITLREIIYDIGGGIPKGKAFKAVQTGGPSGGCLPASLLDTPVDFDSLTSAGSMMGSGSMVVMDEDSCMVDVARYFLAFTQDESCGKCTPCRLGTRQMLAILEGITSGKSRLQDINLLLELGKSIKASSLCGLGQAAPNPVTTTIGYFRDEYEEHINEKRCQTKVCQELIS